MVTLKVSIQERAALAIVRTLRRLPKDATQEAKKAVLEEAYVQWWQERSRAEALARLPAAGAKVKVVRLASTPDKSLRWLLMPRPASPAAATPAPEIPEEL
jgi:hypothetical protein